jgi:hypothetical protein
MEATLNSIWGHSLRLFYGWFVDPTWKANWGAEFMSYQYPVGDIHHFAASGTRFVDIHEALEVDETDPEVITIKNGGKITSRQLTAHAILFLSTAVATGAMITADRDRDANGFGKLYVYDIYCSIRWTCLVLKGVLGILSPGTTHMTLLEMAEGIGETFRKEIRHVQHDESKVPLWVPYLVMENPTNEIKRGMKYMRNLMVLVETDPDTIPTNKDLWRFAPHNAADTESNFQFKDTSSSGNVGDRGRDVGEALLHLYFDLASKDVYDPTCEGLLYTSIIMHPFLSGRPVGINEQNAKTFLEVGAPRNPDWYESMGDFFQLTFDTIWDDPPQTAPSSPTCNDQCLPFKDEINGTCQALPDVYVPKDVSIPVTNQTPLDVMVKWDGKPAPTYLPILKRDASGVLIIDKATLKPILDAWVPVANPTVPALPASCSGPAPPKPGGNPCTVCVPFMDKDGTCKPTQPLYVPKDATVTVVDENTLMVPFTPKNDGTDPSKAYTPNVVKMPDGTMQIQGWIDVVPSLIKPPVLPETCKKPDPTPSGGGGGGGGGGGEGAIALVLLLILALLLYNR